ncbi:MAG: hypothetical protein AMXMBFR59_37860 [Rhodanobacteraceae bacterium]
MKRRFALVLGCAILSGCATSTVVRTDAPVGQPADADHRYETIAGREPSVIDPLRAALAPAAADLLPGKSPAEDQERLAPQSYVLVGTSHHRHDDDRARQWIAAQGVAVGADTIRTYAPAGGGLDAAYFVRVRLVFGATFRDLNAQERKRFPAGGVTLGDIVGDSPASRANLRAGDIVTALDGVPVNDRARFQSLLRARMGSTVELNLARGAETVTRKVQLGRTFTATP